MVPSALPGVASKHKPESMQAAFLKIDQIESEANAINELNHLILRWQVHEISFVVIVSLAYSETA